MLASYFCLRDFSGPQKILDVDDILLGQLCRRMFAASKGLWREPPLLKAHILVVVSRSSQE